MLVASAWLSGAQLSFMATSVVFPMDLLRLPLILLVGFWFYAEALDLWLLAGALLILADNLFNIRAEQRRQRAQEQGMSALSFVTRWKHAYE